MVEQKSEALYFALPTEIQVVLRSFEKLYLVAATDTHLIVGLESMLYVMGR